MSGALQVPATPAAKPAAPAAVPDHTTPIPPAPKPRQPPLAIILKPGLERQADLPPDGGTGGGATPAPDQPATLGANSTGDPEAAQAAAESLQRFQAQQVAPATGQEAKVTIPAPAARTLGEVLTEEPAAANATAAGAKPNAAPAMGVIPDIAVGVAESPKAIVGGIRNAGEELLDTTKSVADWLTKNVGDIGGAQVFDVNGNFDPKIVSSMADAEAQGAVAKTGHILPSVGAPRSTTGNVISGITQFLTGFAVGGKVLGAYADAAKVGKVTSAFIKSAFSDATAFDPAQERLSNLIEASPELRNPVTKFLAAKPEDSEAIGRLKNALEGLGIGGAMQLAFIAGLKGLRAARSLGHAPPPVDAKELANAIGDVRAPLVSRKPPVNKQAKAASVAAGASADAETAKGLLELGTDASGNQVFFNTARVDAPDDVRQMLQKAADLFSGDVAEAQRGKLSFKDTEKLADDLGMTVEDLMARRRAPNGARTPFTAEEALAARRLLTAAGTKLLELARKAADPINASPADLFNFRRMMAVHYAIQQEVLGARTETARALASWRIGAGSGETQNKAIQAAMEAGGGSPTARDMATALSRLNDPTGALSQAVRQGTAGRTVDAIREAYTGGLLSNWPTHVVNFLGNFLAAGQQIYERGVAARIGRAMGTEGGVSEGEANRMAYAFLKSNVDLFRLGWKAWKVDINEVLGKTDNPHQAAISAETWGMRNNSIGGRTVDAVGAAFRLPMFLMGTADQYFKTISWRMEVSARAVAQATEEGLQGKAFARRVQQLEAMPAEDIKIAAAEQSLYATFNNQMGWFGKTMMSLRESGGALNPSWIVMPFVRTPVNLMRYAFERTPLAPLVGQWRADIAAGGRARDIALSKMATGTIVMGLVQSMAETGVITGKGPSDPGERANWLRQGHLPYSFQIGGHWYSFSRDSTFGTIAGFAADMQDTLGRGDVAPDKVDEWQEVMAGGITAVSQTALDKSFLSGIGGFMDMMSDPQRYAPSEIDRQIASFLPFTGLAGGITRASDQTVRDVRNPWQALEAKIPGLASQLIPRRDLWGQVVTRESGLGAAYDLVSPFQASTADASPIDKEMERLRSFPQSIGWKTSINGVAVDFSNFPQTLDRYRALSGNDWKHPAWNMGLKDFLDSIVTGKSPLSQVYQIYSDGEQGGKQAFIRKWIQDYREQAGRALLADPKYIAFKAYYDQQKAAQQALKQRVATQ